MLALHLDVVAGLRRIRSERVDQQLEHERDVVALAGLADALREILLGAAHRGVGVGPVPGQHLHGIAARALDLLHRPIVDLGRQAAARGFFEDRVLEREDHAARGVEHRDAARIRVVRVEQHRRRLRLQLADEHLLEPRDILPRRLRGAALLADRVLDRRPLVDRRHLEAPGGVRHATHAPVFPS